MPIQTQNVERIVLTENNLEDFNNRINLSVEVLMKKGLKVAIDRYSNSRGFYKATITGYKIIKEW